MLESARRRDARTQGGTGARKRPRQDDAGQLRGREGPHDGRRAARRGAAPGGAGAGRGHAGDLPQRRPRVRHAVAQRHPRRLARAHDTGHGRRSSRDRDGRGGRPLGRHPAGDEREGPGTAGHGEHESRVRRRHPGVELALAVLADARQGGPPRRAVLPHADDAPRTPSSSARGPNTPSFSAPSSAGSDTWVRSSR